MFEHKLNILLQEKKMPKPWSIFIFFNFAFDTENAQTFHMGFDKYILTI